MWETTAVPTVPQKLDTIATAHGITSDDDLAPLLGVKGRQSIYNWRMGGTLAKTSRDRIERAYRKALEIQRDSHRDDNDYRRRAIAAINMLEGDALRDFSKQLVTAAADQEFTSPGAEAESDVDSDARSRQRSRGKKKPAGA